MHSFIICSLSKNFQNSLSFLNIFHLPYYICMPKFSGVYVKNIPVMSTSHSNPLFNNTHITFTRFYSNGTSNRLTHINEKGDAYMVDVTHKHTTIRTATARAVVKVGPRITVLIKDNLIKKGDVLSVAQIAGILGAKRTSEIIPLCHNIPLTNVKVVARLEELKEEVVIYATVSCQGKTGVEMEALTAVTVSALTVYDMCKSVSHSMEITDIMLLRKTGGVRGDYHR